jgi:putative ABC transport system permease protein
LGCLLMGDFKIVGVVNDFHERSLHEPLKPSMFTPGLGYMKFITISLSDSKPGRVVSTIQQQWNNVFPDKPFDYFLMDEFFARQYGQDHRLVLVFGYFSIVGMSIACLGLFGFTYFMTNRRMKEIGIRRILGANMFDLIRLLSVEFLVLFLIAGVVGIPVSLSLVDRWLSTFPFRMSPEVWDFILPMAGVGLLSFSSMILLLIEAGRKNPTDALRYE